MLQRRLIEQLRDANIAGSVTDELPASHPAVRITGTILRFDRAPNASGGFTATVALKLRADDDSGTPMLDDYYRAELPAAGNDIKSTVDAYGAALDKVFAEFYVDLATEAARMRDDASLRRLEEMGFAVYVPRALRDAAIARGATSSPRARVVLLARAESTSARALLAQVARALAFARVEASIAADAARIGDAAGLVVFGESLAREVGAAVPAERQEIDRPGRRRPARRNRGQRRGEEGALERASASRRALAKTRAVGG